jgi:hypothetical protein
MLFRCLLLVALVAACDDEPTGWSESFPADDVGWLLNVGGSSPTDIYAVGGSPEAGVAMHYDGDRWSEVDLGVSVPLLTWIHATSPTEAMAVGFAGTAVRWDGSSWTVLPTPTDEDLWGVWGGSPDNLWAVGGRGREAGQATLLHFNGTDWSEVELPELQRANVNAFFKVWGTSAGNVYVVGQRGAVLHYDGTDWTEELVGASDDLISLWGTGPDNIVAVGGRGTGIVSIWDGTDWRTESLSPLPGLNGVWTDTAGIAHVCGSTGTVGVLDLQTLELDQAFPGTSLELHSIFSADGRTLFTVGGNLLAVGGPYRGIAYDRTN